MAPLLNKKILSPIVRTETMAYYAELYINYWYEVLFSAMTMLGRLIKPYEGVIQPQDSCV